jgi:hypothetical protein
MWAVSCYVCGVNHNTLHLILKAMKKSIIYTAIAIAFITLSAFTIQQTLKKGYAEVDQQKGFYIFVDSKPLMEYEFLGEVKAAGMHWSTPQYTEIRNELIDRCSKDYPRADGIIIYFITGQRDRAEAIKFKD